MISPLTQRLRAQAEWWDQDMADLLREAADELEQRITERDEAVAWLNENFLNEDDDPDEWRRKSLADMLHLVFQWGDQAWYMAGKEAELREDADARLREFEGETR